MTARAHLVLACALGFIRRSPPVLPRCPISLRETPSAVQAGLSEGKQSPGCTGLNCPHGGSAPQHALQWLELQQRFAFDPGSVTEALRAGVSPQDILARFDSKRGGEQTTLLRSGGVDQAVPRNRDPKSGGRDPGRLEALGARVLPITDAAYPVQLAALADAPAVLLVQGCVCVLSGPAVAIVGARAATRSARSLARRLGRDLAARGLTIISGLARGIDAEAHRGALEVGGRTVGVLAGGLDRIYPPEHRELVEEMTLDGAVLSEVPLGTSPRRELFPLRNRIISGLSLGIIVVEARRRSGSLITVRHALNQGREVWVVPGSSEGPFAEGSNHLLREGARAIRRARDVIEDLGGALSGTAHFDPVPPQAPPTGQFGRGEPLGEDPLEQRILEVLSEGPATREDLCTRVELDSGRLAQALLCLELADRIIEERDGRFHLCFG